MSTPIIEITSPTILQIGDSRVLVEPTRTHSPSFAGFPARIVALSRDADPMSTETRRPAGTAQKASQIPANPGNGTTYLAPNGEEIAIAQVVGRDAGLWFVVDAEHRPVALRWIECQWRAVAQDDRSPEPGDYVQRGAFATRISEVIGEAEVGGWAVRDDTQATLHVLRSAGNRWMSLGAVTPLMAAESPC